MIEVCCMLGPVISPTTFAGEAQDKILNDFGQPILSCGSHPLQLSYLVEVDLLKLHLLPLPVDPVALGFFGPEDGSGTLERSEFVEILSDPTVQQTLTRRPVTWEVDEVFKNGHLEVS